MSDWIKWLGEGVWRAVNWPPAGAIAKEDRNFWFRLYGALALVTSLVVEVAFVSAAPGPLSKLVALMNTYTGADKLLAQGYIGALLVLGVGLPALVIGTFMLAIVIMLLLILTSALRRKLGRTRQGGVSMELKEELFAHTHPDMYGPNYQAHLLEQYKVAVEMADRVSQRRMAANTFFISANSAILTVCGVISALKVVEFSWHWTVLVAVAGLLMAGFWWWIIRSYRQLNSAKFTLVHEIEELLPARPFKAEWVALGSGKNWRLYSPLTHAEQWVPLVFAMIYVGLFVLSVSH